MSAEVEALQGPPTPRRLFSSAYDSVSQRTHFETSVRDTANWPQVGRAALVARMRLDVVLSGQVVLTDAQVLDGRWFECVDPADLEDAVSVLPWNQPALVLRMRKPSLEESLLGFVTTSEGALKPFEFSLLDTKARTRLLSFTRAEATAGQRRAPRDLAQLLQLLAEGGVPAQECERLRRHWSRWIAFVDRAPWSGHALVTEIFEFSALNLVGAVEAHEKDLPRWQEQSLLSPSKAEACVEHVAEGLRKGEPRTDLYARVDSDIYAAVDRQVVREYIDRVFGLAFAHQHGCRDFASSWRLPLRPVHQRSLTTFAEGESMLREMAQKGLCEIEMPNDFLARLALLPSHELQAWSSRHQPTLSKWRDEEDEGRLLRNSLLDLEDVLRDRVSADALSMRLLSSTPAQVDLSAKGQVFAFVKRYVDPGGIGGAALDLTTAGIPRQAVAILSKPVREARRVRRGNAAIITTDIAVPRREVLRGHRA